LTEELNHTRHISFTVSPLYIKLSDKHLSFSYKHIQFKLRDFQFKLLELFKDTDGKLVALLHVPTGGGKTVSLLIPLLANLETGRWFYQGVTGVYPSRELAMDQMITVSTLLQELGAKEISIGELVPVLSRLSAKEIVRISDYVKCFTIVIEKIEIPVVLAVITSESLTSLKKVLDSYVDQEVVANNFKLLEWFWSSIQGRAYRILFTVPEYPYLLASAIFRDFHSAGVWLQAVLNELVRFLIAVNDVNELRKWFDELEMRIGRKRLFEEYYVSKEFINNLSRVFLMFRSPVFFDEFHLYSGLTLASFLALYTFYIFSGGVSKVIISSATPEKAILVNDRDKKKVKNFLELIERFASIAGYEVVEVKAKTSNTPREGFDQVRKRTYIHFILVPTVCKGVDCSKGAPAFGVLQRDVPKLLRTIDWVGKCQKKGKGMIVVDRVATVLAVAEELKNLGEKPLTVTSMTKLFPEYCSKEKLREARLIVGNIAIAFGVDIKGMDFGLVIAKDFSSALQKVGRFGRGHGDGIAEIYMPVPLYKEKTLKNIMKRIDGEVPYVSDGESKDFVSILRQIYLKPSADILFRSPIGVFKVISPLWVYTFTSIVRERSDIRAELSTASSVEGVSYLHIFVEYLRELESFLGVRDLAKKLQSFICRDMYLTPLSLYYLYSYRSVIGVPIKREIDAEMIEDILSLIVAGRNIPLKFKDNELYYDGSGGKLYGYFRLWISIYEDYIDDIMEVLKVLRKRVILLRTLVEFLRKYKPEVMQDERRICLLHDLIKIREIPELPIMVFLADSRRKNEFVEHLSAVGDVIPIYAVKRTGGRIETKELLGGVYLL